ncbi:MAG TPA: FAD-binding and (Fe-S)-binding domain-containing protein [Afipia sp.]
MEAFVIPALSSTQVESPICIEFLSELRMRDFEGDIAIGHADRIVLSTDNSIYQTLPQAVIFPKHSEDVMLIAKLTRDPRFADVTLAPRGGGTGTNGQSLTSGVVVDLSRHMNAILEIDPVNRWARVQPGVVKDQLNAALKSYGLFFAPELSTSNRATIGGMISTDASGQGSCLYGKTREHVLELSTVLLDGTCWRSFPIEEDQLEVNKDRMDLVGAIHRVVDETYQKNRSEIEDLFPKLNRCLTGYDLAHIRDREGRFDLNAILCGSEGTLGFITEAKLNLLPIPPFSAIICVQYATFDAALRDASALMDLRPASIETIDSWVFQLYRTDVDWKKVQKCFPDTSKTPAQGVNFIEFVSDDKANLEQQLLYAETVLSEDLQHTCRMGHAVTRDKEAVKSIWNLRKKAVGLLGSVQGEASPIPFVEDTAVPPDSLADYIAEFRSILDRHKLAYGMFGHVDAGVLHVRPAIDMKDSAQERLIRSISDEVSALTLKYGGLLWGEHGKGLRSEFAPRFFGALYGKLQAIKATFDPNNQLNPGKIAAPDGYDLLTIDGVATRGQKDREIPPLVRRSFDGALHCNGNAACFNFDLDDPMCPSWKATRDRRHSPKGRAGLVREWLSLLAAAGFDPLMESRLLRSRSQWRNLPVRILNTIQRPRTSDFSHEVKVAMDGCLACKTCTGQCPIKVDIPTLRSKFLEIYHGRYLRPPGDILVASLETVLPYIVRVSWLYNAVVSSSVGKFVLRLLGLVHTPKLSKVNLLQELRVRGVRIASARALNALNDIDRAKSVVLVQDTFTSHFDTQLILDVADLLEQLGFTVWLAPLRPNGKPLYVQGFLKRFEKAAQINAAFLNRLAACGVSLVGLDPAMTLAYRGEYALALGRKAPHVLLLQEWLARAPIYRLSKKPISGRYWLLPHCTERTNAVDASADWSRVFRSFGLDLTILPSGCCGMAGTYGHSAANRSTSEHIYSLSWNRYVSEPAYSEKLLATGYSCRCQARLIDGVSLVHPLQALLKALNR